MTDIEKFWNLYKSLGVTPEIENYKSEPDMIQLALYAGMTDKVFGYSGFVTDIRFDLDGNFISQGVWE